MDQSAMMALYSYDTDGYFVGVGEYDPLGPVPALSTANAPPACPPGKVARYVEDAWIVTDPPAPNVPAPLPAPTPTSCTRRQGRLALLERGLLDDVEDAIAAIADPAERRRAQVEYDADKWERDNAFLRGMWAKLGGDEAGLDDLFTEAVRL